jgi:hypothetical protein
VVSFSFLFPLLSLFFLVLSSSHTFSVLSSFPLSPSLPLQICGIVLWPFYLIYCEIVAFFVSLFYLLKGSFFSLLSSVSFL